MESPDHFGRHPYSVQYLVRDALFGLAYDAQLMLDTPWYRRTPRWHRNAMRHIQNEACRIAKGEVSERDLIG